MSQKNVEAIRASYDALNRREYDAWISALHPDIKLHELANSPDAVNYSDTHRRRGASYSFLGLGLVCPAG